MCEDQQVEHVMYLGETPRENAIRTARQQGVKDLVHGLDPDPAKYGARPGSAWAKWYFEGYYTRP